MRTSNIDRHPGTALPLLHPPPRAYRPEYALSSQPDEPLAFASEMMKLTAISPLPFCIGSCDLEDDTITLSKSLIPLHTEAGEAVPHVVASSNFFIMRFPYRRRDSAGYRMSLDHSLKHSQPAPVPVVQARRPCVRRDRTVRYEGPH